MYVIRSKDDLHKLHAIKDAPNILVRFVMNGCVWCVKSQHEWEKACKDHPPKEGAIVEVEQEFIDPFNKILEPRNIKINVSGFPTIMMIKGRDIDEVKSIHEMKKFSGGRKKLKTRRRRKSRK